MRFKKAVSQRGAAMLEFAICLPLILSVICGAWSLLSLLRTRQQVTMVAHAVMREAAAGVTDENVLTALAAVYGREIGMNPAVPVRVSLGSGGLSAVLLSRIPAGPLRGIFSAAAVGTQVRVSAIVPFSGFLGRLFPAGMPLESSVVLLIDPWKSPFSKIGNALKIPGGTR